MPTYDASNAECLVFTFKEGLLSPMAHDLKIRVTEFNLEVDEDNQSVSGSFDPTSLRVVCAMKEGAEAHDELSEDHKKKIEGNIVKDVLHAKKFPEISFDSSRAEADEDGYAVTGQLELHGTSKEITTAVRETENGYTAEVDIHQPDYGIKPYTAMLGTLKVKPGVRVHLSIPKP